MNDEVDELIASLGEGEVDLVVFDKILLGNLGVVLAEIFIEVEELVASLGEGKVDLAVLDKILLVNLGVVLVEIFVEVEELAASLGEGEVDLVMLEILLGKLEVVLEGIFVGDPSDASVLDLEASTHTSSISQQQSPV